MGISLKRGEQAQKPQVQKKCGHIYAYSSLIKPMEPSAARRKQLLNK